MQPEILNAARRLIASALAEDIGTGDITCLAVIPEGLRFKGVMAAREEMVVAGIILAGEVFRTLSPLVEFKALVKDGDKVGPGTILAEIKGPARELLTAERTALNLLQHLSGIATLTSCYVKEIAGTGARLLDTRKTLPGMRLLAKYATKMGGAKNHRLGLYDGVLIKDNHIAICGGVTAAVKAAQIKGYAPVEVECDTLAQVEEAVKAEADIVLLDNMDLETLKEAVAIAKGKAATEASGGVKLENIRAIALCGVDFISVGRITQSAPAIDIGLDWGQDEP